MTMEHKNVRLKRSRVKFFLLLCALSIEIRSRDRKKICYISGGRETKNSEFLMKKLTFKFSNFLMPQFSIEINKFYQKVRVKQLFFHFQALALTVC